MCPQNPVEQVRSQPSHSARAAGLPDGAGRRRGLCPGVQRACSASRQQRPGDGAEPMPPVARDHGADGGNRPEPPETQSLGRRPSLMSPGPPFFSPAECRWLRWRMSPPLGSIVIGNEGLSGEIAGRAYSSPKVAVENAPLPPLPPLPGSLASVTFPLAPPSQTTVQLLSFPRCCAHTRFLSSVPVAGTRGPPKPSYRLFASVAASGGVGT